MKKTYLSKELVNDLLLLTSVKAVWRLSGQREPGSRLSFQIQKVTR
jgi:hypothetical protein